jgi:hypothetical protein
MFTDPHINPSRSRHRGTPGKTARWKDFEAAVLAGKFPVDTIMTSKEMLDCAFDDVKSYPQTREAIQGDLPVNRSRVRIKERGQRFIVTVSS